MKTHIKNKPMKWWLGYGSIFLLFLMIGIYGHMKLKIAISGIDITAFISDTSSDTLKYIEGNANKAIYITINGREIFIEKNGKFKEPINLPSGMNIITIEAQDKFGHVSKRTIEVFQKDTRENVALSTKLVTSN